MAKTDDVMIRETDVVLYIHGKEGWYDVDCYDGYAFATLTEDTENAGLPKNVKLTYPTKAEVLANKSMTKEVLEYRGLYDLKAKDIHFGDIMMCRGDYEIKEYNNQQ